MKRKMLKRAKVRDEFIVMVFGCRDLFEVSEKGELFGYNSTNARN